MRVLLHLYLFKPFCLGFNPFLEFALLNHLSQPFISVQHHPLSRFGVWVISTKTNDRLRYLVAHCRWVWLSDLRPMDSAGRPSFKVFVQQICSRTISCTTIATLEVHLKGLTTVIGYHVGSPHNESCWLLPGFTILTKVNSMNLSLVLIYEAFQCRNLPYHR